MSKYYIDQPKLTKSLTEEPSIHDSATIHKSYLGAWTSIGARTSMLEVEMGDYSYAMDEVMIHYAEVGKFCSIASHVCINPGNHPMWRATQHHMTYRRASYSLGEHDDDDFFDWRRNHKVNIGHDVWIGHGATILPGVTIGNGAVIGSGAVVTKDVNPYCIVAGVPAKPIRFRFQLEIIDKLQNISWWDWPRDWLHTRLIDMNNVEIFIEKYSKN